MKKLLLPALACMLTAGVAVAQDDEMPDVTFPDSFEVKLSVDGLEVTQGDDMGTYTIYVEGECSASQVTITVETPEGYDGFVGMSGDDVSGGGGGGIMPLLLTGRPDGEYEPWDDPDWMPLYQVERMGGKVLNSFTFLTDGEEYQGTLYLMVNEMVDVDNMIYVEMKVTKTEGDEDPEPTPGEDPVWPSTFDVELSASGLTVEQGEDQGVYTIKVTGECAEDMVNVMLGVPEGWTGFVGMNEEEMENPGIDPLRMGKYDPEPAEWMPIDNVLAMGMTKRDSFKFPVDGDDHNAQLYLYKDDMVDVMNMISVEFKVAKKEATPDPEWPESFDVELSCDGPKVEQGEDQGVYSISVTGECTQETVTVMLGVPEGWDGFVGMIEGEMEEPGVEPLRMGKYEPEPAEWMPIENVLAMGMTKRDAFTFKADGDYHQGILYLYKGDVVDVMNMISIDFEVTKNDQPVPDAPEFPAAFGVELSSEGLTVEQGEDQATYTIRVSGETEDEELTVTLTVPEGWTGYIGRDEENQDVNVEPLAEEAGMGTYYPNPQHWMDIAEVEEAGMKKGNSYTFKNDGEDHYVALYLYLDDKVEVANLISLEVNVSVITGVAEIESAAGAAHYYNIHGVEVKNPKDGLFIKVADGKAMKVMVK